MDLQHDASGLGLAASPAFVGGLQAVIGAVARHVHQRVAHQRHDPAIKFGIAAAQIEFDDLAGLPRQVADQPGQPDPDLAGRLRAGRKGVTIERTPIARGRVRAALSPGRHGSGSQAGADTVEGGEQRGVVAGWLGAGIAKDGQDGSEAIDAGQDRAEHSGDCSAPVIAGPAERRLHGVRHAFQPRQAEKTAAAFHAVHQAKDGRQGRQPIRRLAQLRQGETEIVQSFACFDKKFGEQVVHSCSVEPAGPVCRTWQDATEMTKYR